MRALPTGILGAAALLTVTAQDVAAPSPSERSGLHALSIGSPNEGRLDGGTKLAESSYLRVVPYYVDSDARWGLPSLVGLIDRAARRVARRYPHAILSVGDLSRRGGGELDRHHSHESGRDADVGFYVKTAADRQVLPAKFVAFSRAGTATAVPGLVFDDARNWALVEALLDEPVVHVSHIFVAAHIRARLLRYAEATGASEALRERAAEVMMQPRRAAHDDHFHVRITCPREQRSTCVEQPVEPLGRLRPPVSGPRQRSGTVERPQPIPAPVAAPRGIGAIAARDLPEARETDDLRQDRPATGAWRDRTAQFEGNGLDP